MHAAFRVRMSCVLCAQLKDARSPCRTAGRRAGELLLAAAAGKLSWSHVLTGALTEPQLGDAGIATGTRGARTHTCRTLSLSCRPQPQP